MSIELANYVGEGSVFMDVDSIALGRDFRQSLHESLESCDALLALIGPDWLDSKDAAGRRRLDDPADFVRQEIAAALKRNIPVTPVLLQRALMPTRERLPDDLKDLAFRNGFELSHTRWRSDVREMIQRLRLGESDASPVEAQEKSAIEPIAIKRSPALHSGAPAVQAPVPVEAAKAVLAIGRVRFRRRRREGRPPADGESHRLHIHGNADFGHWHRYGVHSRWHVHHGLAELRSRRRLAARRRGTSG